MKRRSALAAIGLLSQGLSLRAHAQAGGSPIRMVVPYAAGGGIDAVARTLAQAMAEELKQPIVVDNRGGAGGTLGADAVARAPADGRTLLLAGNPELTIAPALMPHLPYKPERDFSPLVLVAQTPVVLVGNADLHAKTLREAVDVARKKSAGLSIGTPGNGTPQHLAVELLRSQTGIDFVHVAYKGAAPATAAAVGGEISFALVGAPPVLPHMAAGKLVGLAVTQPKRSPLLPTVPTMGEAIGAMQTDDFVNWYGLLAPAKTPSEVLAQFQKVALTVLARPDVKARIVGLGSDLMATPEPAFGERIRAESKRYAEVIRRFNIQIS